MKRFWSLLLCLTLAFGPLAGCGGQKGGVVPIDDPAAAQADPGILTEKLLAKAAGNPVVTAEDHPRWTGFTLGYFDNLGERGTTPRTVELCAEWGFNSARVMLPYTTLFSADVTEADLTMLHKLDEMVAAAIERDIHLNIVLNALPGRNAYAADAASGYTSTGEFDLFINEEKQETADPIFRILAQRYQDVPNYNLSFSPLWEPTNPNLSTGLPAPEYTPDDVAAYLGHVIDVIRAEDEDRLIIYEATNNIWQTDTIAECTPTKAAADARGNVIITYNFCQAAYVYACMTETEGKHIDNMNSSLYLPEYPNYLYSVPRFIEDGGAVTIDGLLPAGTVFTLQIENSWGGTLDIRADGQSLYREQLSEERYEIGERLSGFYPYAESSKEICVTFPEDTDELVISMDGGSIDLCGMMLVLPEEYAVERWYFAQPYDVYMGLENREGVQRKQTSAVMLAPNDHGGSGRHITIHDDLTFTSEHVYEEASPETIAAWSEAIAGFDGNCVIRFERADFSGTTWDSMKAYYEDLLQSFEEHGFGWWSNDWWLMTEEYPQTRIIAECPSESYAGYPHFNREMLELFQKYQSKD